jgi:hypothetical protein
LKLKGVWSVGRALLGVGDDMERDAGTEVKEGSRAGRESAELRRSCKDRRGFNCCIGEERVPRSTSPLDQLFSDSTIDSKGLQSAESTDKMTRRWHPHGWRSWGPSPGFDSLKSWGWRLMYAMQWSDFLSTTSMSYLASLPCSAKGTRSSCKS